MGSTNKKVDISIDEIMASLKRSSLPTIVVEGADDMIVYRHLEETLSALGVSVLPVGGRNNVLQVFSRRKELSRNVHISFIADKDIWVNLGIPGEYRDDRLILTDGYSIENDIYIDGELWRLLSGVEMSNFTSDVKAFLRWYALALSRHIQNESETIKLHPDHVLNTDHAEELLCLREGEAYPDILYSQLYGDYQRALRGKSLMALLIRHTNYKGREPRHNSRALMEVVAKRPGALLNRLYSRVKALYADA